VDAEEIMYVTGQLLCLVLSEPDPQVLGYFRLLFSPVDRLLGGNRYLLERKQFGAPLAALQINQEKLVRMLGNIQAMFLLGWRLCKIYEAGKMTPGQASLSKVGFRPDTHKMS
jgi:hypothetical protein